MAKCACEVVLDGESTLGFYVGPKPGLGVGSSDGSTDELEIGSISGSGLGVGSPSEIDGLDSVGVWTT